MRVFSEEGTHECELASLPYRNIHFQTKLKPYFQIKGHSMSPVRFHVEAEVSVLHPTLINLCLLEGCAFSGGKWVAAHEVFHFPALQFPLPILYSCLPPSCRASPQHQGRMGKGRRWGGERPGRCPRGSPVPVASLLPPELSLQHLRASGRLARRLADVLLIREMLEQNTRCEQLLNAVCPELAGQAVTLVLWSVCLFIFSLFTDLVSRSRLRVLAVLKFCWLKR